jgi:sucrose-6-phosphate hydrolase SacC (GH32 family)
MMIFISKLLFTCQYVRIYVLQNKRIKLSPEGITDNSHQRHGSAVVSPNNSLIFYSSVHNS